MLPAMRIETKPERTKMTPTRSTEEIQKDIDNITDLMKGRLPNFERACLHEDRKELRAQLSALEVDSK